MNAVTSILVMIICLFIIIQIILIKNNKKRYNKDIKDLLTNNLSVNTHKYAYYVSLILLTIICIPSYILFIYSVLGYRKSDFDLKYFFLVFISLLIFCISYFFIVWILKHSHYLKNDYCLVYCKNNKRFLILKMDHKKMLVVPIMSCKIINNELLQIERHPIMFIKDVKELNDCEMRYLNNKVHLTNKDIVRKKYNYKSNK